MKNYLVPKGKAGKLSIISTLMFFTFLSIFFIVVESGERGGNTFFSNMKLTPPFLFAATSGVFAFCFGIYNLLKQREFTILVLISTLIGAFVVFWISGEILFPH